MHITYLNYQNARYNMIFRNYQHYTMPHQHPTKCQDIAIFCVKYIKHTTITKHNQQYITLYLHIFIIKIKKVLYQGNGHLPFDLRRDISCRFGRGIVCIEPNPFFLLHHFPFLQTVDKDKIR